MKNSIYLSFIFFFLPVLCLIYSCHTNGGGDSSSSKKDIADSLKITNGYINNSLEIKNLQGAWFASGIDNAIFLIKDDSLFYAEDQRHPLLIKLSNDTLIIYGDVTVHCKIVKLTNDSLWYTNDYNVEMTKLFKCK